MPQPTKSDTTLSSWLSGPWVSVPPGLATFPPSAGASWPGVQRLLVGGCSCRCHLHRHVLEKASQTSQGGRLLGYIHTQNVFASEPLATRSTLRSRVSLTTRERSVLLTTASLAPSGAQSSATTGRRDGHETVRDETPPLHCPPTPAWETRELGGQLCGGISQCCYLPSPIARNFITSPRLQLKASQRAPLAQLGPISEVGNILTNTESVARVAVCARECVSVGV